MSFRKPLRKLCKRNIYYFALASSAKKQKKKNVLLKEKGEEKKRKFERERKSKGKHPKIFIISLP